MELVDYPEMRRKIHEAVAQIIDEEETENTLLSGWNLIYEGVHEDNKRSLTFITSDATGDNALTPWAARGFMEHIKELFFTVEGDLPDGEEDEDDYED